MKALALKRDDGKYLQVSYCPPHYNEDIDWVSNLYEATLWDTCDKPLILNRIKYNHPDCKIIKVNIEEELL